MPAPEIKLGDVPDAVRKTSRAIFSQTKPNWAAAQWSLRREETSRSIFKYPRWVEYRAVHRGDGWLELEERHASTQNGRIDYETRVVALGANLVSASFAERTIVPLVAWIAPGAGWRRDQLRELKAEVVGEFPSTVGAKLTMIHDRAGDETASPARAASYKRTMECVVTGSIAPIEYSDLLREPLNTVRCESLFSDTGKKRVLEFVHSDEIGIFLQRSFSDEEQAFEYTARLVEWTVTR